MSLRTVFTVRGAGLEDVASLTAMCLEARKENIATTQVCVPDADRLASQIRALLGEPQCRVTACWQGETMCGFVISRLVPPGLFYDTGRLQIEAMFVAPAFRRKGAGHALLEHLAGVAVEQGADEIVCQPLGGSRSALRFFARLGFAPAAGYRVIGAETLARRLQDDPLTANLAQQRMPRRRRLDDLIAARRRHRGDTGEIPVVVTNEAGRRPQMGAAR